MATKTEEEVKKEENPETLTEEEKAAALKAEEEGEDATEIAAKEKEEAEKVEAAEKAASVAKEKESEELNPEELLQVQVSELRERNVSLDTTIRSMETQLKKYGDVLKEANMLEEVDEEQQKSIERAEAGRRIYLDQLFETMAVNPKYDGIEELVTVHNKQLVIDAYTEQLMSEDPSLDKATAEMAVLQSVDELKNPHKFYYDQIKIIEKGAEGEKTEEEKKKEEIKKKDPELTQSPGSLANMGGAGKGDAGWTMKKLDEMDEETMNKAKIPDEILEQWKSGTLPK